jgi:hypothetical protein
MKRLTAPTGLARNIGRAALSSCEADYRPGFKAHVRERLKAWFEEQSPRSMHTAIEDGTQRAWIENRCAAA